MLFVDWYPPAYKAGGPIRSCENFTIHMKSELDIYVFTSDRDLGDKMPFKDILPDQWCYGGDHVQLYYASTASLKWDNIKKQILSIKPDYIYLNSMYSKYFSIYPLLMKHLGKVQGKIVLSPRGMLKKSALSFKPLKKKIFLLLFNAMSLQKHISFHATDLTEMNDIKKHFGSGVSVMYIPNFPGAQNALNEPVQKNSGSLKMLFIGRVHPIKNLHYLLECLTGVKTKIELMIVAAIDNPDYWEKCKKIAKCLPANINVSWVSNVPHHELEKIIFAHHILSLPTQGENFGHAIFEALSVGRPVLISDQTPWRGLEEKQIGWDLPLNAPSSFANAIETAANWDQQTFNYHCSRAWDFVNAYLTEINLKKEYQALFSN